MHLREVRQGQSYHDYAICDLCQKRVKSFELSADCKGDGLGSSIHPPYVVCTQGSVFNGARYIIGDVHISTYTGKKHLCDTCIIHGIESQQFSLDPENLILKEF